MKRHPSILSALIGASICVAFVSVGCLAVASSAAPRGTSFVALKTSPQARGSQRVDGVSPRARRQLVFESNDAGHIVRTNMATRRRHDLGQGVQPRWSPNGRRILYLGPPYGEGLMLMGAGGHHKRALLAGPTTSIYDFAWAPAGRRIAVVGAIHRDSGLFVYSLRTGEVRKLQVDDAFDSLDWSWTTNEIAFTAVDGPEGNTTHTVKAVRPSGTGVHTVLRTSPNAKDEEIRWSPGGNRIAFVRLPEFGHCYLKLLVVQSDGTNLRRVPIGCTSSFATWSLNGHRLLTDVVHNGKRNVISVGVNGLHRRLILRSATQASWRPR